jgi:hypothetical protein
MVAGSERSASRFYGSVCKQPVRPLVKPWDATESVCAFPGKALRGGDHRPLRPMVSLSAIVMLEDLMAERNLSVDHTTVWRWLQRYASELNRRVRRELKRTGACPCQNIHPPRTIGPVFGIDREPITGRRSRYAFSPNPVE